MVSFIGGGNRVLGENHRPANSKCNKANSFNIAYSELSMYIKNNLRKFIRGDRVMVMMLNATCNNISVISWRSVLLVKEKYKYV